MREKGRNENSREVDHIVAYKLWEEKLNAHPWALSSANAGPDGGQDDLKRAVNEVGNCMLIEKNFNISKSANLADA